MGKLACSGWRSDFSIGWESIEMVRRYAHRAPNHLTEHARQIDSILGTSVPNLSHSENKEGTNDM